MFTLVLRDVSLDIDYTRRFSRILLAKLTELML
jgi:hypothetical protein